MAVKRRVADLHGRPKSEWLFSVAAWNVEAPLVKGEPEGCLYGKSEAGVPRGVPRIPKRL